MKTLFISWKITEAPDSWFPIGRLDADIEAGRYEFCYIRGALQAKAKGFHALDSFPMLYKRYVSGELFPFFMNRVQGQGRPGFCEHLRRLGLAETTTDMLAILALSEGRRATDNLEVFPKLEQGGPLAHRCLLHNLRQLDIAIVTAQLARLQPGEELRLAVEIENGSRAVQLQTRERVVIGYLPRYLARELVEAVFRGAILVSAVVSQVNLPPAPLDQRVLVLLTGRWPDNFEPMDSPEFQDIG